MPVAERHPRRVLSCLSLRWRAGKPGVRGAPQFCL